MRKQRRYTGIMRAGMLLLVAALTAHAETDQRLEAVLDRVSEEAEVFATIAPKIMACGKVGVAPCKNYHLDLIILCRSVKGRIEIICHLKVLCVSCLGPVLYDSCDSRYQNFIHDSFVFIHRLSSLQTMMASRRS